MSSKGDVASVNDGAREATPDKTGNGNSTPPPRRRIAVRLTVSIAIAGVAIAVAVVLVVVFLMMPSPMTGTYVTADGRKLELQENGAARYGVSYKNVWMTTTYKWSRSGDSVKLILPGVPRLQPGYKIRGTKLVGNGGVWVKR